MWCIHNVVSSYLFCLYKLDNTGVKYVFNVYLSTCIKIIVIVMSVYVPKCGRALNIN